MTFGSAFLFGLALALLGAALAAGLAWLPLRDLEVALFAAPAGGLAAAIVVACLAEVWSAPGLLERLRLVARRGA
jgi:hypothetical protein